MLTITTIVIAVLLAAGLYGCSITKTYNFDITGPIQIINEIELSPTPDIGEQHKDQERDAILRALDDLGAARHELESILQDAGDDGLSNLTNFEVKLYHDRIITAQKTISSLVGVGFESRPLKIKDRHAWIALFADCVCREADALIAGNRKDATKFMESLLRVIQIAPELAA